MKDARGKHGLTLIQAWISIHIHHKVWDEIPYHTLLGMWFCIHADYS